ncbi:hypothetical protein J8F10_09370 [Gemmata sp. G18]|uniref:Uncharacterized protein n=1 Tax=Gemmata palustris TaxID=2822762 RepID=A0ABS5BQA3_9BACT|nr:hypothetical protein [Gemmata palustris]MBP3955490.1 hypothetical protein [Gemmata palustris]
MARRPFDPFVHIPSPEAVREKLEETRELVRRLRVLLTVSVRVHEQPQQPPKQKAVPHAR